MSKSLLESVFGLSPGHQGLGQSISSDWSKEQYERLNDIYAAQSRYGRQDLANAIKQQYARNEARLTPDELFATPAFSLTVQECRDVLLARYGGGWFAQPTHDVLSKSTSDDDRLMTVCFERCRKQGLLEEAYGRWQIKESA